MLLPEKNVCCGFCGKAEMHNKDHECTNKSREISKCCGAESINCEICDSNVMECLKPVCSKCRKPFEPRKEETVFACGIQAVQSNLAEIPKEEKCSGPFTDHKDCPIHSKPESNWEEEFDKIPMILGVGDANRSVVKSFIHKVLTQAREEEENKLLVWKAAIQGACDQNVIKAREEERQALREKIWLQHGIEFVPMADPMYERGYRRACEVLLEDLDNNP